MSFAFDELQRWPSKVSARNILMWDDLQEIGKEMPEGKQCEFSFKDTGTQGDLGARELCDLIVCKDDFGSCVENKSQQIKKLIKNKSQKINQRQ